MKKFITELFCSHIYHKTKVIADLGTETTNYYPDPYPDTYKVEAIELTCVKCNKQKIIKDYTRIS